MHRRQLLDLMNRRAQALTEAQTAFDAENQADFDAAMQRVSDLDTQIANVRRLVDAEEALPAPEAAPAAQTPAPVEDATETLRGSREYARAFCNAVRAGLSPATAGGVESARVLLDALTEGTNADGGFLVPVDLQTRINELMRELNPLRNLVNVERVTTRTGYRVLDTKPTAGFTLLTEMGQVPTDDQPAFSRIDYTVKDYGLIVPISNDLLADNDAGLMEYLARWMAKKRVITENGLILAQLATLTPTDVAAAAELAAIKTALNVSLDPAIAAGAVLLTNQSGYNYLDQLCDKDGRPLLQPDVANGSGYLVKGKRITACSNSVLANVAASGSGSTAVTAGSLCYVGDLKQFITIFDRMAMEFTTTNIGGSAWRTNSTEGRAIMRLDVKKVDTAAAVALKFTGVAAAG